MSLRPNIRDREQDKFTCNTDEKTAVRVVLTDGEVGDTPPDLQVTLDPAANPTIYNLSVLTNVITPQAINDGAKKILIKPREAAKIEMSYDNGFSTFFTIPKGNAREIIGIKSSSLVLYLRADKDTVIEIEEWT